MERNFGEGAVAMNWLFSESKAVEVASFFLNKAGGRLDRVSLLKLMYLAERAALGRFRKSFTGDQPYSMQWGPVLTHVYDIMKQSTPSSTGEGRLWMEYISSDSYYLNLEKQPEMTLSKAEIHLLEEVYAANKDKGPWVLSDLTHEFPEWENPGKSSRPISLAKLLEALGVEEEEREEIESLQRAHNLLASFAANS